MKLKIILTGCIYLCFIGLILYTKKPICIDSKVVQKIDIVTDSEATSQTAFSCESNMRAKYSIELINTVAHVEELVKNTITVLDSIKPFKKNIQIEIYNDHPLKFSVDGSQIKIGRGYLNLGQHLSRAVIKSWINENKIGLKIDTELYDESLTDLILFIIDGKIELEDPLDKVRTKIGSVKWPQVIKSIQGYCASSWKYSEHAEECSQSQSLRDHLALQTSINPELLVTAYSLRPLLTSALIYTYVGFDYTHKQNFVRHLPKLISDINLTSDKAIESMLIDSNPLRHGIININKFTDLVLSADLKNKSEIYQMYTGITQYLQQAGVVEAFAEANFDFMIEYAGELSTESKLYKQLEMASYSNSQVQIALKDSKHIWILPSKTALPINVFNKLRTQQLIYINCPISAINIADYYEKAEKLMLINHCDKTIDFQFSTLFISGVKSFIAANPKINFIQLHMPSLELIKDDIPARQNFFEMVKNRDLNQKEFRRLGWSQVQWNSDIKAYRPNAVIDAIEYYRN